MQTEKKQLGPILAAITPFMLALVFVALGTRPAPATTAKAAPPLAFAEYVVNMGPFPVQPRPIALARFQFTNRSQTDIEFMKETPSCGCLSPGLEKKIWAPGETGDLYMRVQTAGQKPGPHEYTLHLEYGPPGSDVEQRSEATLTYKVVFPEQKITVEPRALLVYQLGESSVDREVVISDMRGDFLKIESIKTESSYVTAKQIGDRIDKATGTKKLTLMVSVSGSVPKGDSRALINVQTNDKRFPMLQIPVLIRGPQRPNKLAIHTKPELMVLSPSEDKTKLVGELQLVSKTGQPLKIRSIRADPPVIQAAHTEADQAGSIKVSAFVTNEQLLGFNRGMLTIETEEPGVSRIEVPVMLRGIGKTKPKQTTQKPVGPPTR